MQINSRAQYSISFEGSCPDLYMPQDNDCNVNAQSAVESKKQSQHSQNKWTLYLPKAYHPILLQQHRHNLKMALKNLKNANAVSPALFLSVFHQ